MNEYHVFFLGGGGFVAATGITGSAPEGMMVHEMND